MTAKLHLDGRAFDELVGQAVDRLPEEIRRHLNNIVISVQSRPDSGLLADLGLPPDTELFGVYIGTPLPERSLAEPPLYPDVIHIFQEPLESFCRSREEIVEEIEITLVHEVAHFVGFGEEEIARLGYA